MDRVVIPDGSYSATAGGYETKFTYDGKTITCTAKNGVRSLGTADIVTVENGLARSKLLGVIIALSIKVEIESSYVQTSGKNTVRFESAHGNTQSISVHRRGDLFDVETYLGMRRNGTEISREDMQRIVALFSQALAEP